MSESSEMITISTPNQTGSNPSFRMIGNTMGMVRRIVSKGSIIAPKGRYKARIIKRMAKGDTGRVVIQLVNASGSPLRVRKLLKIMAPMRMNNAKDVNWTVSFSVVKKLPLG
jgi:hypothetical protein